METWHVAKDFFRFPPFSEHDFFPVECGLPFRFIMIGLHISTMGKFKFVRVGDIGCPSTTGTSG